MATNRNQGKSSRSSSRSSGDTSNRGFASMDKDKQREIARKGGEASQGGGRSGSSDRSR